MAALIQPTLEQQISAISFLLHWKRHSLSIDHASSLEAARNTLSGLQGIRDQVARLEITDTEAENENHHEDSADFVADKISTELVALLQLNPPDLSQSQAQL